MHHFLSRRIGNVPRSFIREILKDSLAPDMISFAGGLPNKNYFPVAEIQEAAQVTLSQMGAESLQYSNSEGVYELRQLIARRYREKKGLEISPDSILITNGSQQCFDLLGKVLLDPGDTVLIEEPGYLGAIQSLSLFETRFDPVRVDRGGIDVGDLRAKSAGSNVKMLYTVPNFQNPSGVSYSEEVRNEVAQIARENNFIVIEDDPYGELRFQGEAKKPLYAFCPERTILLGTFSKTVAPGLRLGWMVAPEGIYEKLITAKQAADLHTSSFNQYILATYLTNNSLDAHLQKIIDAYGCQCRAMIKAAREYLPDDVTLWEPEGGMFLWGKLPPGYDSMALFDYAMREKVVYVPGAPFYTSGGGEEAFRLSFSCVDPERIETGMKRLARAFTAYKSR